MLSPETKAGNDKATMLTQMICSGVIGNREKPVSLANPRPSMSRTLADVGRQEVQHKLLEVVEHVAALAGGRHGRHDK